MRIAFFYHPRGMPNSVNPYTIWSDARGLTGSEMAFFMYAILLAELGHDVCMFSNFSSIGKIGNASCVPYNEWETIYRHQDWDAAIASTIIDPLVLAKPDTFRMVHLQCKSYTSSTPGWEPYVDIMAPLSHSHARVQLPDSHFPREKYRILYNGVETSKFNPAPKIPGKIIWASSLDRGCHWLLEAFPKIRKAVPEAELHLFYNFHSVEHMAKIYSQEAWPGLSDDNQELGIRSRYILECINRLQGHGVHPHGSVSRDRMIKEMRESYVLAYPLDPVYYTETFGVTVLEACASGTVPVICAADAFGELWGKAAECVPPPYSKHKDEWVEKVIRCLRDKIYWQDASERCVDHAKNFEWSRLVLGLEECIKTRGARGLPEVEWNEL